MIFFVVYTEWRGGCTSCGGNRTSYSPSDGELWSVWHQYGRGQQLEWTWRGKLRRVGDYTGCPEGALALPPFTGGDHPSRHKRRALWAAYGVVPLSHYNGPAGATESGGGT
jgi:hypothetical protein